MHSIYAQHVPRPPHLRRKRPLPSNGQPPPHVGIYKHVGSQQPAPTIGAASGKLESVAPAPPRKIPRPTSAAVSAKTQHRKLVQRPQSAAASLHHHAYIHENHDHVGHKDQLHDNRAPEYYRDLEPVSHDTKALKRAEAFVTRILEAEKAKSKRDTVLSDVGAGVPNDSPQQFVTSSRSRSTSPRSPPPKISPASLYLFCGYRPSLHGLANPSLKAAVRAAEGQELEGSIRRRRRSVAAADAAKKNIVASASGYLSSDESMRPPQLGNGHGVQSLPSEYRVWRPLSAQTRVGVNLPRNVALSPKSVTLPIHLGRSVLSPPPAPPVPPWFDAQPSQALKGAQLLQRAEELFIASTHGKTTSADMRKSGEKDNSLSKSVLSVDNDTTLRSPSRPKSSPPFRAHESRSPAYGSDNQQERVAVVSKTNQEDGIARNDRSNVVLAGKHASSVVTSSSVSKLQTSTAFTLGMTDIKVMAHGAVKEGIQESAAAEFLAERDLDQATRLRMKLEVDRSEDEIAAEECIAKQVTELSRQLSEVQGRRRRLESSYALLQLELKRDTIMFQKRMGVREDMIAKTEQQESEMRSIEIGIVLEQKDSAMMEKMVNKLKDWHDAMQPACAHLRNDLDALEKRLIESRVQRTALNAAVEDALHQLESLLATTSAERESHQERLKKRKEWQKEGRHISDDLLHAHTNRQKLLVREQPKPEPAMDVYTYHTLVKNELKILQRRAKSLENVISTQKSPMHMNNKMATGGETSGLIYELEAAILRQKVRCAQALLSTASLLHKPLYICRRINHIFSSLTNLVKCLGHGSRKDRNIHKSGVNNDVHEMLGHRSIRLGVNMSPIHAIRCQCDLLCAYLSKLMEAQCTKLGDHTALKEAFPVERVPDWIREIVSDSTVLGTDVGECVHNENTFNNDRKDSVHNTYDNISRNVYVSNEQKRKPSAVNVPDWIRIISDAACQ